jgi:hypothetical protein
MYTFTPMLAPTTLSAATTTFPSFNTLTLGRSAHAIELLVVPTAPHVHASTDLKAHCFEYLANLLLEHSSLYSSNELIATFEHIPGSTYNARLKSTIICSSICSTFFQLDNLISLGFCTHLGVAITGLITTNPATHPAGLFYFAVHSTITPATIDAHITIPSFIVEFWLALPQTLPTIPALANATDPCNLSGHQFTTPTKSAKPAAPSVQTATDLTTMDSATLAGL